MFESGSIDLRTGHGVGLLVRLINMIMKTFGVIGSAAFCGLYNDAVFGSGLCYCPWNGVAYGDMVKHQKFSSVIKTLFWCKVLIVALAHSIRKARG